MIKKSKKLIIVFCLTLVILILTSCGITKREINQMNDLHPGNEYQFVFTSGITVNNEHYYFQEMVDEKIKADNKKLLNSRFGFRTDDCYLIGDNYFFLYRYYQKGEYGDYDLKYAIGYIDVKNIEVYILKYYDDLDKNEEVYTGRLGNKVVYVDNELCAVYDSDGMNVTHINLNGYNLLGFDRYPSNKEYIKDNHLVLLKKYEDRIDYRIFDEELNETEFSLDIDANLLYFKYPNLVYYKNSEYKGIDLSNSETIDKDEAKELVLGNSLYRSRICIDGKDYEGKIYDYYDDDHNNNFSENGFLTLESEDFKRILEISEIRDKVPEVKKVEKIFGKEIFFVGTFCENNELYLLLQYDHSFFGYYGGQSLPIVIKYDIDNDSYKYIGYLGNIHAHLIKVYKL